MQDERGVCACQGLVLGGLVKETGTGSTDGAMSRGVQIPITPATPTASRSTTPSIHPPACATARHPRARGGRVSRRAAPRPGLAPQTPRAGCRWGTLAPSSSVHTVIGATLGHAAAAGSAQEKLCRAAALKFPQNCARLSPASGDSRAATGSTRCARCVAKLSFAGRVVRCAWVCGPAPLHALALARYARR